MAIVQQRRAVPAAAPARRRVPRAVREALFVIAFWLMYSVGCVLVTGRASTAFSNARRVWDFERAWHLPSEPNVQWALITHAWLIRPVNVYYANVHFLATGIFLLWLYRRRPEYYLWSRRVLAVLTASALVIELFFPLAPPRMRAETGMVDLGAVYGPTVYGSSPQHDYFENQYAAMPSIHVAWATILAIGMIMATGGRWRWLWLLHPIVTALIVVATANHYVLDVLVAWILLVGVLVAVRPPADCSAKLRSTHPSTSTLLLPRRPNVGA